MMCISPVQPPVVSEWGSMSLCRLFGSKPQKKIEEPLQNPLVYSGPVYYIDTQERVEHWCKIIKEQVAQMAIDAEWRPEFKRNQNHPLALLQLCFRNAGRLVVVLVHLKYTGVPKNLANILQVGLPCEDSRQRYLRFSIKCEVSFPIHCAVG